MTLTFADLPLRKETIAALNEHGYTAPFPIQEQVLSIALADGDVIGQAKTGTGKTLAFGIPLVDRVIAPADEEWKSFEYQDSPQVLVVVPTRELCVQVTKDLEEITQSRKIRVLAVYGGRAFEPQIEALQKGVEIIVGTPGRLLDLYRQGQVKLASVTRVVLDEADEMLDLGFLPDVEKIFASTPNRTQTMLFSATMPGDIIALARKFMNQPVHIRTQDSQDEGNVFHALNNTLYAHTPWIRSKCLPVFCRQKVAAQQLFSVVPREHAKKLQTISSNVDFVLRLCMEIWGRLRVKKRSMISRVESQMC